MEEERNNSSSPLTIKNTMIISEEVHSEEREETMANQSMNKGVDEDYTSSSSLLSTLDQLSGNAKNQPRLIFLVYYLLSMFVYLLEIFYPRVLHKTKKTEDKIENTASRKVNSASKNAEAAAQKINELLSYEIGHKVLDLRDLVHKH